MLGEPSHLAAGVVERVPDHLNDLPDLGFTRVLRLYIFDDWPLAVLAELLPHVVEGLRELAANLLPDSEENLVLRNLHRRLECHQSVPGRTLVVSSHQRLRIR